jgi:diguanylate cyclase (GGDEF)-like protein
MRGAAVARKKPTVLVVDNDPHTLTRLTRELSDAGHGVLTAGDGLQALGVLGAEGPPIVVTEWVMPAMSGLELCRAIRAHEGIAFAYVIVLTKLCAEDGCLVEAFEAGADDFLLRPYDPKELLARIRAGERIIGLHDQLEHRNRDVHRVNAELAIANRKLTAANEQLNRMATYDELTGLVNRREALGRLAEYWESATRHGGPLACIVLDIDHFKRVNDAHGHGVGDVVLKETAAVLRKSARQSEAVSRTGGEEFLVLCPRSTMTMAAVGAERLRRAVEANAVRCGGLSLGLTVSLGVAERTLEMKSPDDLLRAADRALYAAKDAGRNTVRLADGGLAEPAQRETRPARNS